MTPVSSARWITSPLFGITAAILALTGPPEPIAAQTPLLPGGSTELVLTGNDFQCNIDNESGLCHAFSPTASGAVWPKGSSNGYLFNSGPMFAAIIGSNGGPWAGDTVSAFFFNTSGGTNATPITNIWNSLDPAHRLAWPSAGDVAAFPFLSADVDDPAIFGDALLDQEAASQQDTWLAYWDGGPQRLSRRPHPAGVLIQQRTLAWNYPSGNEGTLYVIWEITNISNDPYFQRIQESSLFDDAPPGELPDGGWTLEDAYVAYGADPDVTANASGNFAAPILPFDLSLAWDGDFSDSGFRYPPAIFHAPFFTSAPGILGTKMLGTPNDAGMTMHSVYIGGGDVSDPSGSGQLYRYFAGTLDPGLGDGSCTFVDTRQRRVCYVQASPTDTRYFQATGPFDLAPGETATFAVALFAAPVVEDNPGGVTITQGVQNRPTATNEPNAAPSLHPGCHDDPITNIERGAGWIATADCPPAGTPLDIFDVDVVPGSLLHKAQVAQALFDSRFLLPFAPEPPQFEVRAGDDQVTVTWQPSATEAAGDPFAAAATDPASPLYNPAYRADDVEGYRIYRSTDGVTYALVAQFDAAGTTFVDAACEAEDDHLPGEPCPDAREIPLTGRLVQYRAGDIVELTDGTLLVLDADTTPAPGLPPLEDTGIPYEFVDTDVRNGFEYVYRVTAFDVNSLGSGPASLESASLDPAAVVVGPVVAAEDADLRDIRVAPDPYYGASTYDVGPVGRNLRFFNLPPQASIRIFTASGILVDVLNHDDPLSGTATWDLRNRTGVMIASGVYFYHVTTPDGREHTGRFTVVHSGLSR